VVVQDKDGNGRAEDGGEGHGACAGAYRRGRIAGEGGRGTGSLGQVEGDHIDEDEGRLCMWWSAWGCVFLAVLVSSIFGGRVSIGWEQ
jgi:hypothetical protein